MTAPKHEIITFKADGELVRALREVPNRSEFIRLAVLAALENVCPVCRGIGFLTPQQRKHWQEFSKTHRMEKCTDCKHYYIVCDHTSEASPHGDSEPVSFKLKKEVKDRDR